MAASHENPTVQIGDGVQMPMVGFGTWQLSGRACYDATRYALEVGYRHIDTATMYRNEDQVGRALRDSGVQRGEVFVTTKLPPGNAGRERQTLDASLRALGTDHVDLWLVHWPPNGAGGSARLWAQLVQAADDGRARAVGVSNYSPRQIDDLAAATDRRPAVNQIPWSPAQHDPGLLDALRDAGVAVEGYSSLKNTDLDDPAVAETAARHDVTPAQVVLRWHLEHGITVLPKSAHRERIASNFALSTFALSDDEVARLDALAAR